MAAEFLTDEEKTALDDLGRLWGRLTRIVGEGVTRAADLGEMVVHVHALQNAVLAQAAGRAHPGEYRLMGETLAVDSIATFEQGGVRDADHGVG